MEPPQLAAARRAPSALARPLQARFEKSMYSIGLRIRATTGFVNPWASAQCKPMALAVSGGADSMALASLAAEWGKLHHVKFTGLIVDHGLRPEASKEAAITSLRLNDLGISSRILQLDLHVGLHDRFEEKARDARRKALHAACRDAGAGVLLLAHTLDDQLETFLMRLTRKSRWIGLAGTRPLVRWPQLQTPEQAGSIMLVRPMLNFSKPEVYALCLSRNIKWAEDQSNFDATATERNAVRALLADTRVQKLIPRKNLIQTATVHSDTYTVAEQQADDAMEVCVRIENEDLVSVNLNAARILSPRARELVLLRAAAIVSPKSPEKFAYSRSTAMRSFDRVLVGGPSCTVLDTSMRLVKSRLEIQRAVPRRCELNQWTYYPISTIWSEWFLLDGRFWSRWRSSQASLDSRVRFAFADEPNMDMEKLTSQARIEGLGASVLRRKHLHLRMEWEDKTFIGYPTLGIYVGIEFQSCRAVKHI